MTLSQDPQMETGEVTGWPLGLEAISIAINIERGRAAFSSLASATPSFSSLSSSDLATESSRSFFDDRSVTLGTLLGFAVDQWPDKSSSDSHGSEWSISQKKKHGRQWKWLQRVGCIYSDASSSTAEIGLPTIQENACEDDDSVCKSKGMRNSHITLCLPSL